MIPLNNAKITSYYKKVRRDDKGNIKIHSGLDLISTSGDKEVKSIADGTVRGVFFDPKGYGNYVSVQLANNIRALYCHLEKALVNVGDKVKEGDVIGIEGMTGNSTGVHLHLELRKSPYSKNDHVSPADFLGIENEKGLIKMIDVKLTDTKPTYKVIGTTHVIEIDPLYKGLKHKYVDKANASITEENYVNACYFMNLANSEYVDIDKTVKGKTLPQGHIVSEGKVFQSYATHQKPVGTLIVYKNGKVDVKPVLDITKEQDVWFAVSGLTIVPTINNVAEGFTGVFSDVLRQANRPMIGYNKSKNKIVIAVREYTTATRGQITAKNLGCDKMITLDGGGSTNLRVNGMNKLKTSRRIASIVTW
jgi:hypothetical protein